MSLLEQRPEGIHRVRWVRTDAIAVDGREFTRSFVLTPDAVQDWTPTDLNTVDDAAVAVVLAFQPAVVLLGTGMVQRLAPQALMAAFLQQRVGLEAMDNAAAARTFNLLAAEGRRVVAGFLLPG